MNDCAHAYEYITCPSTCLYTCLCVHVKSHATRIESMYACSLNALNTDATCLRTCPSTCVCPHALRVIREQSQPQLQFALPKLQLLYQSTMRACVHVTPKSLQKNHHICIRILHFSLVALLRDLVSLCPAKHASVSRLVVITTSRYAILHNRTLQHHIANTSPHLRTVQHPSSLARKDFF